MIDLKKCPICNSFISDTNDMLKCKKQDHKFYVIYKKNILTDIQIINEHGNVWWSIHDKRLIINRNNIGWIEPDLLNISTSFNYVLGKYQKIIPFL